MKLGKLEPSLMGIEGDDVKKRSKAEIEDKQLTNKMWNGEMKKQNVENPGIN